ncbi:MAG: SpoIIIAH-like family protein [Bacilli bacterium]|nr:SpoIIIAH-like family protein [Bacilli bacterium]
MINKSKLWFLTLSCIILVLAVYYVAIPGPATTSVFSTNKNEEYKEADVKITESEALTAMRINKDEEDAATIQTLQEILLDSNKSLQEKNDAYEQIKFLNSNKSLEEKLEKSVNDNFKINSFISINDKNLKVVIANKEKSVTVANDIISFINATTDASYYVTVKFE